VILKGLVHKVVDFIWYFFLLVKENLLLVILPVEGQILHPDTVPMVGELHARGVDHALNFV
jgi:hypothetical protein